MKILFIGDIFGKSGRRAISVELPKIKQKYKIDLVIANAENTSHGRGLSLKHYQQLKSFGINYFTLGNHTWFQKDIVDVLNNKDIVRPLNIKPENEHSKYGNGTIIFEHQNKIIRLTNLLGNSVITKDLQTNPFIDFDKIMRNDKSDIHIVDFHCETTSEKNAFLLTFATKVTAIVCTHTHVQTADERIFKNTAYISDVGMTGGINGVIGAKPDTILEMFQNKSSRFKLDPQEGKYQFNAVIIEIDSKTNLPINIERINIEEK